VTKDTETAFWALHARAGAVVTLSVAAVNAVYAALTWSSGEHRALLLSINVAALVAAGLAAVLVPEEHIARSPHRDQIFATWCLGSTVLIGLGCHLDGGMESPYAWLFPLSVMFVAIGHRQRIVLLTTAASMIGVAAITALDGTLAHQPAAVAVRLAYLAALGYLSSVVAGSRWRQFESQLESNALLAAMAERDGLTGLLNHGAFHRRLDNEVERARREGTSLALVLIDVDRFKEINDRYGHLAGDHALLRIADVLRVNAREIDVSARVGGEEFCMLLPSTSARAAQLPAERVRTAVAELDISEPLTVSVGVSAFPDHAATAKELFERADAALYEAKHDGRNRVHTSNTPRSAVQAQVTTV
jgi:diguanylate cyclase (GGDEF)-like protein